MTTLTAIADRSAITDPGRFWLALAALLAVAWLVHLRRQAVREAAREQAALNARKRMAAEARARAARNAAALEQHRAEREAICADAAHREAYGHHGVAHLEALANGLVDL